MVGFDTVFGQGQTKFDARPFRMLSMEAQLSKGVLFLYRDDDKEYRCYINGNDFYQINEEIYAWCNLYASVNANVEKTPNREKLVSLAPSFGVRCWNGMDTVFHALVAGAAYLRGGHSLRRFKPFMGNYKRLLQRPFLNEMVPGKSESDYVFFASTLWYNNEFNRNDEGVNLRRARFIRVCMSLPIIRFEGGLVSQPGRSSDELFKDCIVDSPYPYRVWLAKTKRSALVFNTPAFWDCHGWKLGEYLALGKAIVSTPLSNDLPAPLVHGEHIHFVEGTSESIENAIKEIVGNPHYREKLEKGARGWWEKYGTPEENVKRLLKIDT